MDAIFLVDGARYKLCRPKNEDELQGIVEEHYRDIFGQDSIFFDFEPKLRSTAGIGSKPDGCVLILSPKPRWVVIETELSDHPLYDHIIPQISKFVKALENPQNRKSIVEAIYDEINRDPFKKALLEKQGIGREIYKFLNDVVSTKPSIAIIIDEKTAELDEVLGMLPLTAEITELKTFEREGVGLDVHAHLFEPLYEEKEITHAVFDKEKEKFYCNICDMEHKTGHAVGEINEHLRDEHGVSLEDQVIDGWTRKFERLMNEYFIKKGEGKLPAHRLSWDKRLNWVNSSTRALVDRLNNLIKKQITGVTSLPKYRWYYFYKGKTEDMNSLFTVLMLTKKAIKVRIRTDPKTFKDPKKWTKAYKGWFFKRGEEREFSISAPEQLDYAIELIKQSYNISQ